MITYTSEDIDRLTDLENRSKIWAAPEEFGTVSRNVAWQAIHNAYLDGLRAGIVAMREAGAEVCEQYGVDPDPS